MLATLLQAAQWPYFQGCFYKSRKKFSIIRNSVLARIRNPSRAGVWLRGVVNYEAATPVSAFRSKQPRVYNSKRV